MFVVSSLVLSGELSTTYLLVGSSSMDRRSISFIGLGPHWTFGVGWSWRRGRSSVGSFVRKFGPVEPLSHYNHVLLLYGALPLGNRFRDLYKNMYKI